MKTLELNWVRTFTAAVLFGLLGMTARPATDMDLWWHLRTGQWIAETGTVPRVDPFSFTRAGQPWVSQEWLSEVVFYQIWRHLGFAGLIVFSAIVTTAGFSWLYLRCPAPPHWAAAATVLGALASAPSWGVRPQMFTFALTSLLLWLLERGEARPWLLFSIPPLFLLWLNLHAGFALGPALMVAYAVGLVVEAAIGDAEWRQMRLAVIRILAAVLACLALVPLNPSGSELYWYPLETLRSAAMRSYIVEWFSADFHQPHFLPFLLLWLALFAVLARGESRPKARWLVPLVVAAFLSLDAVRHIPIFVLLAVPVIAKGIAGVGVRRRTAAAGGSRAARMRTTFAVVTWILMAGLTIARWRNLSQRQAAEEAAQFPAKAVEVLRSGNYGGRVFVYYDWGGYAIFKLYPKYRVFVDGRADVYGDELLHQFQTAVQLRRGWRKVLDDWHLRLLLVPPNCALTQGLALDPSWRVEYRDPQAVILLRASDSGMIVVPTKASPSGQKSARMCCPDPASLRKTKERRLPDSAGLGGKS